MPLIPEVFIKDLKRGDHFAYVEGIGSGAKFIIENTKAETRGRTVVFSKALCIKPGNGHQLLESYQFTHTLRILRVSLISQV